MFCPKCGAEYREGFNQCADCNVALIDEKPPELITEVSYVDLVEVFSTYNPGHIAVIQSVLDGESIHYYFQGESSTMLIGAGAYARLLVQENQVERVRDILQEMEFIQK